VIIPISTLRHLVSLLADDFAMGFEAIAREAAKVVGAEGAALILADGTNEPAAQLKYLFFQGLPAAYQAELQTCRFNRDEGVVGVVFRSSQPVLVCDYPASDFAIETFVNYGLKASFVLPINTRQTSFAALALSWFHPITCFTPSDLQLETLSLLTELLGGAIGRERALSKWINHARKDPLTGLPNRMAMNEYLPKLMARTRRSGFSTAICVLDLDDFKPVNDTFGHAAGDMLLMELAHRLQSKLRAGDRLFRFGGDEFILILDEITTPDEVINALKRIHSTIEAGFDLDEGHTAHVGMSLGYTLYPEDDNGIDLLLRHADEALYFSKKHKHQRQCWWQSWLELAQKMQAEPENRPAIDPYGTRAAELLQRAASRLQTVSTQSLFKFFEEVCATANLPNPSPITLWPDTEILHFKQQWASYLQYLITPNLHPRAHQRMAEKTGEVLYSAGMDFDLLLHIHHLLASDFYQAIRGIALRQTERNELMEILTCRLHRELSTQVGIQQSLRLTRQQWLTELSAKVRTMANWPDFIRQALKGLTQLPGIMGAAFGRPDTQGLAVIEHTAGEFDAYIAAYSDLNVLPRLNSIGGEAQTPTARAWQTGQIHTCASYLHDPRMSAWRKAAAACRVRSAAGIPVRSITGQTWGVVTLLGYYPGLFESPSAQLFLTSFHLVLNQAHHELIYAQRVPPLPVELRNQYRQLLYQGAVEFLYQPVIDLKTGKPIKVEALARLRDTNGSLIDPGAFLPDFGIVDLTRLFIEALNRPLAQLKAWDAIGLTLDISINLPPPVLAQQGCPDWIAQAIRDNDIDPNRIRLELLESEDNCDHDKRDAAIHRLGEIGLRLVMDDLGSGYSSLLRLRTLPFHTVKIDQGLVREAAHDPVRVIGFIGGLTRMAHGLKFRVVIEGLESLGLIEAAAILGADAGQGYAIAKPMSAAELPAWTAQYQWLIDPANPKTALGALAAHWDWAHGLAPFLSKETLRRTDFCALGRYIVAHNLNGTPLDECHNQIHAIASDDGISSDAFHQCSLQLGSLLATNIQSESGLNAGAAQKP
jgi:diguanylate cyclase (GGDEF)-like protein